MLVSRWVLQAYATLRGESNPNFFASRADRNTYYGTNLTNGQLCAINSNGTDPATVDWNDDVWEVDVYSAESGNWVSVYLDSNFALTITNDGIKALTDAARGQYKLEVSRIVIKQTLIPEGTNLSQYTSNTFLNNTINGYEDVCLDTYNVGNSTFTLTHNLTYRTNSLNGGLQLILTLGLDCMGQQLTEQSSNAAPTLTKFNVSAIGIYVVNQAAESTDTNSEVLFAVANLPASIEKLTTTPSTIGNSVKLYLNCTLSNLGNTVNMTSIKDTTNSIPEVTDESDLIDTYDGINAPYNIYLVDNYHSTNMPALAVRKGSPLTPNNPINWTYFTPTDDSIEVSPDLIDSTLKNYMVAAWNPATSKYVPANPKNHNLQMAGLYVDYHLIYAGKVNNVNSTYYYETSFNNTNARDYKRGDTLICSNNGVTFVVQIVNVEDLTGKPLEYYVTPKFGNTDVNFTDEYLSYAVAIGKGRDLRMTVHSRAQDRIVWDFDPSWVGQALYVSNSQPGILTNTRTGQFVGWCVSTNSIKLGLDLRNEATETVYGTTRYATNAEVNNVAGNQVAMNTTSVTPEMLQNNYLQTTIPGTTRSLNGNEGNAIDNPILVNTYTQFDKPIYGKGTSYAVTGDLGNVSFYGTAYRALWADLAEYYKSDRNYPAGTLICIGSGINEITIAQTECNGIVSTKPGYELGEKRDQLDLPVALVGKVPVLFAEDCSPSFGDKIYLSKTTPGKASTIPFGKCLGKIIDKDKQLSQKSTIMCSVRIEF